MSEIRIYDEIVTPSDQAFWGLGVSAQSFAADLAAVPEGDLVVRINSPGGDVDNGLAIYNLLLEQRRAGRRVDVVIDGAAHSAASVIAMAGDAVRMAATASMLIHDPWSFAMGNADDLRARAGQLDTAKERLLPTYQQKTGLGAETISALMTAETELLPAKAKELKFADEVLDAPARAAALRIWALDQVKHPLARRALEQIQARAQRGQPRQQAQEQPMQNQTPAGPAPAPAPAAETPAQVPEEQRRAAARAKLVAKRVPTPVLAWADQQPLEAAEAFAEQAQAFPMADSGTRPADAPPSPAPLPKRASKAATPAHAAVARRLGLDPAKMATHLEQPWHAKAEQGPTIEEMLDQAADEPVEAAPVTPEQAAAAAAMGVSAQQLEQHRKAPWHRGRA